MQKLKERWGITSNFQLILILIVFSINGSFAAWVAKPITEFIGISPEINGWALYIPVRVFLIFPIYQATLPLVGLLFGQCKFFWEFEKKILTRMGLGFLFKKKTS